MKIKHLIPFLFVLALLLFTGCGSKSAEPEFVVADAPSPSYALPAEEKAVPSEPEPAPEPTETPAVPAAQAADVQAVAEMSADIVVASIRRALEAALRELGGASSIAPTGPSPVEVPAPVAPPAAAEAPAIEEEEPEEPEPAVLEVEKKVQPFSCR